MANNRRDGLSSVIGLLVFLAGIGLILLTFQQAWEIFSKAPQFNMGLTAGKAIDFGVVAKNLSILIVRILLLVVMAGIGSALANRGVRMYSSVAHQPAPPAKPENPDSQAG